MSEKEKMLNGNIYDPNDEELLSLRQKCHDLCRKYNQLSETDVNRYEILKSFIFNLKKMEIRRLPS